MLSQNNQRKQLIPLRRLADNKLYSTAYLSLLVQRKKLKAKKIGRNFYTTQEWFEDYFEKHARDEKRAVYDKLLLKKDKRLTFGGYQLLHIQPRHQKVNFFVFKKIFNIKTVAISMAIFILLFLATRFMNRPIPEEKQGQVAGIEEKDTETATSTSAEQ